MSNPSVGAKHGGTVLRFDAIAEWLVVSGFCTSILISGNIYKEQY